ncbi:tyrosine-type recombinase/integrase [Aquisalimonas sp.]|uniref:tyrosine-type recombinase/integrase n=1 Tax=Aquisalimonas sp. TaxID=1872621 RepID=UPI0025C7085B|nr:tyrosine-type recombinase/integrase [Aquisalimonas sp.]
MTDRLGGLLFAYLEDHLKCQRGLRPASIRSYQEGVRLFLQFLAKDKRCKITRLALSDLTGARVRRFLQALEQERGNGARTRNQRLAAVRSFFEYLADREPCVLGEAQRVACIPVKRAPPCETLYLERDEISALFAALPSAGPLAVRDQALLHFLYNTGARVQEAADLRVSHLELGSEARARLHGKGDKWRICPLWSRTADVLERLLEHNRKHRNPEDAVFLARNGTPLTRFGIYKLVRRHTAKVVKKSADGTPRPISPHVLRHTTAVHLLEAGVEVNVIRAWLGHVSLETTNRYAEINMRIKVDALRTCEPVWDSPPASPRKPIWHKNPELLQWLESL